MHVLLLGAMSYSA